jgi:hypothetical protein
MKALLGFHHERFSLVVGERKDFGQKTARAGVHA